MSSGIRKITIFCFSLLSLFSFNVKAGIITYGCVDVDAACTLAELSGGASIKVDDLLFHSWDVRDFSNNPILLDDVRVRPSNDLPDSIGLTFSTGGSIQSSGLDLIDLLLGFSVAALDSPTQIVSASTQLTDFSFGTANVGGFISAFDSIFDPAGDPLADLFVQADNLPLPFLELTDMLEFSPTSSLFVEKTLLVSGDAVGDVVVLNEFVQQFGIASVPAPGTSVLLITGLLGIAWLRRRSHERKH